MIEIRVTDDTGTRLWKCKYVPQEANWYGDPMPEPGKWIVERPDGGESSTPADEATAATFRAALSPHFEPETVDEATRWAYFSP